MTVNCTPQVATGTVPGTVKVLVQQADNSTVEAFTLGAVSDGMEYAQGGSFEVLANHYTLITSPKIKCIFGFLPLFTHELIKKTKILPVYMFAVAMGNHVHLT